MKDWVRLKVRHYPLQKGKEEVQKQENTNMNNTDVQTNAIVIVI